MSKPHDPAARARGGPGGSFEVTTDDGVRLVGERWPGRPGAPIVLGLHGITGNRKAFLPVVRALDGDADFVCFDARGRGLSDKPTDPARFGHRRNAEDARCVLEHLGASDVVVLGQSMGAWVGLQLAAHHPALVRALVMGDGGYFRDLPADLAPAEAVANIMGPGWLDRLRMTAPSRDFVLGLYKSLPAFDGWWGPDIEALLDAGLVDVEGGVRSACSDVAAEVDSVDYFVPADNPYVKADLPLVTCPAHLVRAAHGFAISPETMDPMMTEAAVEEFQAALPQLTVETVPGSNHYSVNFGPAGAAVLADAVRKALR
jgi:pimeloyl-ACP methyl ester carboxylesterase